MPKRGHSTQKGLYPKLTKTGVKVKEKAVSTRGSNLPVKKGKGRNR